MRLRLVAVAALFLFSALRPAGATEVFVVSSYHEGDLCGQPQYEAAVEALRQSHIEGLRFRSYHLDSRRRPPEEVHASVRLIVDDLRRHGPDLVLTVDDPAFALLYRELLALPSIPLVFTGLNRPAEAYSREAPFLDGRGRPDRNITGVFEHLFMREQLALLETVLGRPLRKVALLHSTDPVGLILKEQIVDEVADTPYADALVVTAVDDLEEVRSAALAVGADERIDAYIAATLSIASPGGRLTLDDVAPLLTEGTGKIDLALNSAFAELGFFGGVSVDFYQMGFQAGLMAAKLLKGQEIARLPVERARRSLVVVNRRRVGELGLRLPAPFLAVVDRFLQ